MRNETPYCELIRLRKEQTKTREDEVFLGLSPAERAQYDQKTQRINVLENKLQMSGTSERSAERGAEQEQRSRWNQQSETDIPRSEAHQPYRSREERRSMEAIPNSETATEEKAKGPGRKRERIGETDVCQLPRPQ